MSEYQYYEFRAIDKPLTPEERDELRRISSRAEITSTGFTNTYNFGDLKGKPAEMVFKYFDAYVYVANWGSHELMFRIPEGMIDTELAEAYCVEGGEVLSIECKQDKILISLGSHLEEGEDGWDEGEDWMPSLIGLRAELMRGDFRALYIAWLASLPVWRIRDDAHDDELDPEYANKHEPPVPAGMGKLSAAHKALSDFLRVDDILLKVAASTSSGEAEAAPSRAEFAKWIESLPVAEKNAFLTRLLAEEESEIAVRSSLALLFQKSRPKAKSTTDASGRRTIGELLDQGKILVDEESAKAGKEAAEAKEQKERAKAAERKKHLDQLAKDEPAHWSAVEQLIALKQAAQYDRAVVLLLDLRELSERSGRVGEFTRRMLEIRSQHKTKSSFIDRMNKKGLR